VPDPVSKDRLRGIRIYDITDIEHPKNVGTCRPAAGSHTHTGASSTPKDKPRTSSVYISGLRARCAQDQELARDA
jgi:hypothetical protein